MSDDAIRDFVKLHVTADDFRKRCDPAISDSTRNDQAEVLEVRGDVQSEAVARHPSRDPDADGRKLFVADPRAGQSLDAPRFDPEIGGRLDQHFLEVADVAVHVAAIGFQIEDRIANELPRTVIGDVAAAAGFMDVDAARSELIGRGEYVRPPAVAANAEREDVRMLEKDQQIADAASLALGDQRPLQRKRVGVGNAAKPADFKAAQDPSSPDAVSPSP